MRTQEQDARGGLRATSLSVSGAGFTPSAPGVTVVKGAAGVFTLYFAGYRSIRSAITTLIGNAGYTAAVITQPNIVQVNCWSGSQVGTDFGFFIDIDGFAK